MKTCIFRDRSRNIVNHLQQRECGFIPINSTPWYSISDTRVRVGSEFATRRHLAATTFPPNCSILNIEKPSCYMRKFSPDGRFLLAFGTDLRSLEVYQYNGYSHLYKSLEAPGVNVYVDVESFVVGDDSTTEDIRKNLFKRIFSKVSQSNVIDQISERSVSGLQGETLVGPGPNVNVIGVGAGQNQNLPLFTGFQLIREFCLFTEDSRFAVLCAACQGNLDELQAASAWREMFRSNEAAALPFFPNFSLEDYILLVVAIPSGIVTSARRFNIEKFSLFHQQAVSLCGSTLAFLSVNQQLIYLMKLLPEGSLFLHQTIGRTCADEEDSMIVTYHADSLRSNDVEIRTGSTGLRKRARFTVPPFSPAEDMMLCSLKQKLLSYLYTEAQAKGPEACRQVIQRWDDLCSLKIWRIHLLSEDVLLLKYCLPETLQLALCSRSSNADRERDRERDPSLHFALFAFYSIPTQQVLSAYDNSSLEFLLLSDQYGDHFRHSFSNASSSTSSSSSSPGCLPFQWTTGCAANSMYLRKSYERLKQQMARELVEKAVRKQLAATKIGGDHLSRPPSVPVNMYMHTQAQTQSQDEIASPLQTGVSSESERMLLVAEVRAFLEAQYPTAGVPSDEFLAAVLDDVLRSHSGVCANWLLDELRRLRRSQLFVPFSGDTVKRTVAQVSLASQSYSPSPFVDAHYLVYDDKQVSPTDRPRHVNDAPILFHSRFSSALVYKLFLWRPPQYPLEPPPPPPPAAPKGQSPTDFTATPSGVQLPQNYNQLSTLSAYTRQLQQQANAKRKALRFLTTQASDESDEQLSLTPATYSSLEELNSRSNAAVSNPILASSANSNLSSSSASGPPNSSGGSAGASGNNSGGASNSFPFPVPPFNMLQATQQNLVPISTKRLVAFLFHPHEPFVISLQKSSHLGDFVLNVHLHFSPTLPDPPPRAPPPRLTSARPFHSHARTSTAIARAASQQIISLARQRLSLGARSAVGGCERDFEAAAASQPDPSDDSFQ